MSKRRAKLKSALKTGICVVVRCGTSIFPARYKVAAARRRVIRSLASDVKWQDSGIIGRIDSVDWAHYFTVPLCINLPG
jgi:hypothetical protein